MPTFRPDLERISPYVPGRPIESVAADRGLAADDLVKLASNESPWGPFPGAVEAATAALVDSNRYPDSDALSLTRALAAHHGVAEAEVWPGAGSVALLVHISTAVGGPGTSAVFAWPSFVMYRTISAWAMTAAIEVPLTMEGRHDLAAMAGAVAEDTTVAYVCNPNNPTGTVVPRRSLEEFVAAVPERVLIVVDEAYHDFVSDPAYGSALDMATRRPNLVVLRTFSKVYGLAGHRVGYAVGMADTLAALRRTQFPFSIPQSSQAAAVASLGDEAELVRRVTLNAVERQLLLDALSERGLPQTSSEANFVYFRVGSDSGLVADAFVDHGVIVRPMSGGFIRVTVGTADENERFLSALDSVLAAG